MRNEVRSSDRVSIIIAGAILVAGIAGKIKIAFSYPLSNDIVNHALWFEDMTSNHNYLFSNWYVATNNCLFTDFPFQFILGSVLGMSEFSVRLGGLVVFFLLAAMLAVVLGRLYGLSAALFGPAVLFAAPLYPSTIFLHPNFHVGSILHAFLCLWILLKLSQEGQGKAEFTLGVALLFVLSLLNVFSDYMFIVLFTVPAAVSLAAMRYFFKAKLMPSRREIAVILAMALGLAGGIAMVLFSDRVGLHLAFAAGNELIPMTAAGIKSSFYRFVSAAAMVFNMDVREGGLGPYEFTIRLINLILFSSACLQAAPLLRAEERKDARFAAAFFITSSILLIAGYMARHVAHPYYLVPLVSIYAVFLGALFSGSSRIFAGRARAAMFVLFIFSAFYNISSALTYERQPQPHEGLARFLEENKLTYGYASMDRSNIMTFLSGGKVKVRPVRFDLGGIAPDVFHVNLDWYDYKHHTGPTFLIVADSDRERGFERLDPAVVRQMFGMPARTLRYGDAAIYEWNYNIIQLYWINSAMRGRLG